MDQRGRDGFDELLPQASLVIDLPLVEGVSVQDLAESDEQRARQYEALGRFLAKHCQAALALWDGEKFAGMGGTADVVEMIRESGAQVFHILTPREGQPPLEPETARIEPLQPADGSEATAIATRLKALNLAAGQRISEGYPPYGGLLPGENVDLPEFERRVAQAFWTADQSSVQFG